MGQCTQPEQSSEVGRSSEDHHMHRSSKHAFFTLEMGLAVRSMARQPIAERVKRFPKLLTFHNLTNCACVCVCVCVCV